MCRPVFGKRECPICNNPIHQSTLYIEHMYSAHCNRVCRESSGSHWRRCSRKNILTITTIPSPTLSNLFSCSRHWVYILLMHNRYIPLGAYLRDHLTNWENPPAIPGTQQSSEEGLFFTRETTGNRRGNVWRCGRRRGGGERPRTEPSSRPQRRQRTSSWRTTSETC